MFVVDGYDEKIVAFKKKVLVFQPVRTCCQFLIIAWAFSGTRLKRGVGIYYKAKGNIHSCPLALFLKQSNALRQCKIGNTTTTID